MSFTAPPPSIPPTQGGYLGAPIDPNAYRGPALARLRNAGLVTISGGITLLFISFIFGVVTLAFGNAGAGVIFLVFGVIPGIAITVAGARMMTPGASIDPLVTLTVFCAIISLFSTGGILLGAILSFVGAALARSAARELSAPRRITYGPGYGPAPGYAPAPGYSPSPTFTPPEPYMQNPTYGAAPAYSPQPAYAPPQGYPPFAGAYAPPTSPPPPPPPAPAKPAAPPPPLTPIDRFLALDSDRSFDLESLNGLDFDALAVAATSDRSKRGPAFDTAEALLERLSSDIADINTLDDFLRDRLVLWYRDSPSDPDWTANQPARFAGLVSESRTAGGARTLALTGRLTTLRDSTAPFEGPARRAFKQLRQAGEPEPTAPNPVPAQTVQAVLDDIAASARLDQQGATLPLLRLSELAVKVSPAAVNAALADLFKADPKGPFIILHPSRFPTFEFVLIRPPAPRAAGAAIAYDLICTPADVTPTLDTTAATVPRIVGQDPVLDFSDPWSIEEVSESQWSAALSDLERRRERLPPPPSDFRRSPPYFTLRKLVVSDAGARRTFLAVKWRGKPPGIGLLAQLLTDSALQPEFETDAEYLDAELSDIQRGDLNWRPPTPNWDLGGGLLVSRIGDHGAFSYKLG